MAVPRLPSTRSECADADRRDPLAGFRSEFDLPDGVIYFDGNSLGPRPLAAADRARDAITGEWGTGLIRSWDAAGWFDMPMTLGDKLAPLIGAGDGQVVVTDTTSVNLFKALAAALRMQRTDRPDRKVIVTERDNFPTDVYIAEGMIEFLDAGYELRLVDDDLSVADALDDDVAVCSLSHINYRTAAMYDMNAVTSRAHELGIVTIWDLAHSAGAVRVDVSRADADFAIGCTYKYLNGGPGAPAYIWVNPHLQNRFTQPLSGWWSHDDPFAMESSYRAAADIRRYLCGTQPIVSMSVLDCGLDIAARADVDAVREKSLALSDLFIDLVERRCSDHPLTLITPRKHEERGSHVSIRHPEGGRVMQALIARGVIGDYREPEVLRFGLTPLFLTYTDVWDAVGTLADVLDNGFAA